MRILVTGADGYAGARLIPWLIGRGHTVRGTDAGQRRYQGPRHVVGLSPVGADVIEHPHGWTSRTFEGWQAVVHLADSAEEVEADRPGAGGGPAAGDLAMAARAGGVDRFVLASTCGVYGDSTARAPLTEQSPIRPQNEYARRRAALEDVLLSRRRDGFAVTVLRFAAPYGPSPGMRFDYLLNALCAMAWVNGWIAIAGHGDAQRSVVHVEDICNAVQCALEAPTASIDGEIFNVGRTAETHSVAELARMVSRRFAPCPIHCISGARDDECRLSFDKIASRLPGYRPRWTAEAGIDEFARLFRRLQSGGAAHELRAFSRLHELRSLIASGAVESGLLWQPAGAVRTSQAVA